jgi:hypothetical protein
MDNKVKECYKQLDKEVHRNKSKLTSRRLWKDLEYRKKLYQKKKWQDPKYRTKINEIWADEARPSKVSS